MSRVLVTRPQPDADATAALLRAAGHEALVRPLMRIEPRAARWPSADALAFTSANGVRAYDGAPLPAWCVGEASASAARAAGLSVAGIAEGDVTSLAALIAEARPGRVLHPSGAASAGDLAGALRAAGVSAERVVAYDAVAETSLPGGAARAIARAEWVALFSPRSARLLTSLARDAGLTERFTHVRLAALSQAVAHAAALPFAHVCVAPRPASSALVDIISGRDT